MRPGNRRVRNRQFLYAALYVNYRSTSKRRCGFHNRGQYILCERIRVIVRALYTGEPGGATWKCIRTPRPGRPGVRGEERGESIFISTCSSLSPERSRLSIAAVVRGRRDGKTGGASGKPRKSWPSPVR